MHLCTLKTDYMALKKWYRKTYCSLQKFSTLFKKMLYKHSILSQSGTYTKIAKMSHGIHVFLWDLWQKDLKTKDSVIGSTIKYARHWTKLLNWFFVFLKPSTGRYPYVQVTYFNFDFWSKHKTRKYEEKKPV